MKGKIMAPSLIDSELFKDQYSTKEMRAVLANAHKFKVG